MTLRRSLAILVCIGSPACGAETATAPPAAPPPAASGEVAVAAPAAPAASSAPKPSMAEMQKATIAALVAAFNAHDAKKLGELYAQDATIATPAPEGMKEIKGREGIDAMHDGLFKHVLDVKIAPARIFQIGDVAVVEWVGGGSDPASGKKASFRGAMVLTFDQDGLLKSHHTYLDDATIAMQLGHAPGKPRPLATPPSGDATTVTATGSDDEKKTAETMRAGWAIWSKKDIKAYEAAVTDDVVHEDLAMTDSIGKKANVAELEMFAKAVPDMQIDVANVWAAGKIAISEFVFSGTQKGPIGPLKATGKKFTVHGLEVDEFRDGKLAKGTTYDNGREFLTQLGFMPPADANGPAPKADKGPAAKPPVAKAPQKK